MFIPAFIEAYVAFGAGLGLDVVLGSLTGGIEGVATAGLYGAISVVPELSYADGDWSIEGTATLAAGARLKVGLNAWAEVEAFWITVWEETWELGEWVWNVGPDLALQAHMAYQLRPARPARGRVQLLRHRHLEHDPGGDAQGRAGALGRQGGVAEQGGMEGQAQGAEARSRAPGARRPVAGPAAGATPAGPAAETQARPARRRRRRASAPRSSAGTGAGRRCRRSSAWKPGRRRGRRCGRNPRRQREGRRAGLRSADRGPAALPRPDQPCYDRRAARALAAHQGSGAGGRDGRRTRPCSSPSRKSKDSDALDDWFPRIKNRFRLVDLGLVGDFHSGFSIEGGINPPIKITGTHVPLKGTGIPGDLSKKHVTEINHETGTVGRLDRRSCHDRRPARAGPPARQHHGWAGKSR